MPKMEYYNLEVLLKVGEHCLVKRTEKDDSNLFSSRILSLDAYLALLKVLKN